METSRKQTTTFETKIIKLLDSLPDKASIFTNFEDDMIRKYYPRKGATIASILGKTKSQIRRRASVLQVRFEKAR